MRGDEVQLVTQDRKKRRFKFSEEVSLSDESASGGGVSEFSIKSQNLGERTLKLSLGSPNSGTFEFKQKAALHEGFTVTWYPQQSATAKTSPTLVVEIH